MAKLGNTMTDNLPEMTAPSGDDGYIGITKF